MVFVNMYENVFVVVIVNYKIKNVVFYVFLYIKCFCL